MGEDGDLPFTACWCASEGMRILAVVRYRIRRLNSKHYCCQKPNLRLWGIKLKHFSLRRFSPENAKDYHRDWKKKGGEIWSSTGSLCFITRRSLSCGHRKPGHQRYLDERCLSGHRHAAAGWRKSERGYDPYAGRKKEAELATGLDQSFRENSTNGQSGHGRRFWRQVPDSAAFKKSGLINDDILSMY